MSQGYSITGIDFSERSINYAKKKAKENNLDIKYIYRIFDHFYSKATITDVLNDFGFKVYNYYSDIAGAE